MPVDRRVANAALWCLITLGTVWANRAAAQTLPDWSGWWGFDTPPPVEFLRLAPPPMKSADLAALRSAAQEDIDADPYRYCRPSQFVGHSGGFTENIEFLFTPGRVTILNEAGLVRRIYLDRALPENPEESNTGTSVGHWEGQTLVVETIGISSTARYPDSTFAGAMPIGTNVRISERISLKDPDTLEFEIVTIAPDLFVAPDRRKRSYVRLPKQFARDVTFCVDFDRSFDPDTRTQRFDMTPPADLPPPPTRTP